MISLDDVHMGDLVVFASIRTDVTQTLAFGVVLRRLATDEITANFSGLAGTTGVPDGAVYVARCDTLAAVAVSANMIVAHVKADSVALDALMMQDALGVGLTPPADALPW